MFSARTHFWPMKTRVSTTLAVNGEMSTEEGVAMPSFLLRFQQLYHLILSLPSLLFQT